MKYVLIALESEMPKEVWNSFDNSNYTLVFTGVGKVNAAYAATRTALQPDCEAIINYGTAGTLSSGLVGKLHRVGTIYQRDMDARPQAPLGTVPFEEGAYSGTLNYTSKWTDTVSLSTGDNFVMSPPELMSDLVDMEAYAIAKVCAVEDVSFTCWKYASDFADENANDDWQSNVSNGATEFVRCLQN